jgi:hypothetical protein
MAKKRSWFSDNERRAGNPRTEEERKKRHRSLFGKDSKLPARGTGLSKGKNK